MQKTHEQESQSGAQGRARTPAEGPILAESGAPADTLQRTYGNRALGRAAAVAPGAGPDAGPAAGPAVSARPPIDVAARIARTGAPVVQRTPAAKKAYENLAAHLKRAKEIAEEAEGGAATHERLKELKTEIDQIALDAEKEKNIVDGEKAPSASGYKAPTKQAWDQIVARQRRTREALERVDAAKAADEIGVIVGKFKNAIAGAITLWQQQVDEALAALRSAIAAPTAQQAAGFATTAESRKKTLEKTLVTFNKNSGERVAAVQKLLLVTELSYLVKNTAAESGRKLDQMVALVGTMLRQLIADATASAQGARQIADALADLEKKKAAETQAKETTVEKTEQAKAAETTFKEAEKRSAEAEQMAKDAEKLADEAIAAARDAKLAAEQARSASDEATAKASAARGSIAFYEKHAGYAPSQFASQSLEQRRSEATEAEADAEEKKRSAEEKETEAREKQEQGDKAQTTAREARTTATSEGETKAKREKENTSAQEAKLKAEAEEQSAGKDVTAAEDTRSQVTGAATDYGNLMGDLAAGEPDAQRRLMLRAQLGDDTARALLNRGIRGDFLLSVAAQAQQLIGRWNLAAAGDLLLRAQGIVGMTDVLFTGLTTRLGTLNATAPRALQLLDCRGGTIVWHVQDALTVANTLLDVEKWSTADIMSLLKAAEEDAKLDGTQLGTFYTLVHDHTVSAADAVSFLKAGVKAAFLVDKALSSIGTLLAVPWAVDKIVELVVAAEEPANLTKAQFESFCTLVDDNTATVDEAITIMKGCSCSGKYLVEKAFVAMLNLVRNATWDHDDLKNFMEPAENNAKLDQTQLERLCQLVVDNTFDAEHAKKCVKSTGVTDWTFLMDQVDSFVADGNTGSQVFGGAGGILAFHRFRDVAAAAWVRIELQGARMSHFVEGHTYMYYAFTGANIRRGGGNVPSSMWAQGTDENDVEASATAAIATAQAEASAVHARNGTGNGDRPSYDTHDNGNQLVGIEAFPGNTALMQFYPTGDAVAVVEPDTMEAIARLFGKM